MFWLRVFWYEIVWFTTWGDDTSQSKNLSLLGRLRLAGMSQRQRIPR